MGIAGGIFFLA